MGTYLHTDRKLRVNTPLGPDELILTAFRGIEAISTLFSFRLEMLAENDTSVPFDKVLGQKVTIYLAQPDGSETYRNGVCVRFSQGGKNEVFTEYEAEIVPEAWKLTRKAQSRTFQHLTVPEILKQVLTGFPVKWELQGKYEPRDYCVQYRETDFNFAARLMEEEGIRFFFKHSDGDHEMVVADQPAIHPDVPGDTNLVYEEVEGGERDESRTWGWRKEQEIRPGKYVLWDHCFELPHQHLEAEDKIADSVQAGSVAHKLNVKDADRLELYDFPGEYAQRFDGISKGGAEQPAEVSKIFQERTRTVAIRMDEEAAPALVIRAKSSVKHLVAGHKFSLQRHFNADGAYVLTSVRHAATCGAGYRSGEEPPLTYENEFTCIPASVPFRPRRATPKPVVHGSQTAVVVGPAGEDIFTDKYGRVKVQFHWDRQGKKDPDSSCWIRVGTSWAGRNWGAIHIPRIGQEVIVDFLEGDPDQPIIVGSVYNADMMPPYDLPANKTQSGIKSRSSLKGTTKNFNELRFEDQKGSEQVYLHAEKDLQVVVEHDETRDVGHDRTTTIGNDCTTTVKGNRSTTVEKDQKGTVNGSRTDVVLQADSETVQGDQSLAVIGGRTKSVIKDETITITGGESLTAGSVTITSATKMDVTVATETKVSSATVKILAAGSIQVTAGGQITLAAPSATVNAGVATINSAGAATVNAAGAVSLTGTAVTINGATVTLNAGMVTCAGVLMATSVVTSSVVSAAYTPGAGNIM